MGDSRARLGSHVDQFEWLLLFVIRAAGQGHRLSADTLKSFEDTGPGSATVATRPIRGEQRSELLLHGPTKVTSRHAQQDMSLDTLIELVIDRADLQGHRFELSKGPADQGQLPKSADRLRIIEYSTRCIVADV